MHMTISPYLIQSGVQRNEPSKNGVDRLIHFNYMGYAEFEFGAIGKSLERIRKNCGDYELKAFKLLGDKKLVLQVYAHRNIMADVKIAIDEMARAKHKWDAAIF